MAYWAVVGMGTFILLFLVTSTWIGQDVRENCLRAQARYGGDCVEALVSLLDDEQAPFRERNSAIWSLGQLGDKRALPALENLYTGQIPPREPYDAGISQYELKKAIKLVGGSFNATSIFWRYDLP